MSDKKKAELLAPVGDFEKLQIAIHYGADAVYLGGKKFSLRNFSKNFTIEEIDKAVKFARQKNVKVYIACNIYSKNFEQKEIEKYLKNLNEIKPDALIIADTGILSAALELIQDIPLHLSTQANTTNYKSALFWKKFGITRVNAARELSIAEIKEISTKSQIEIEAFVHGSMCISYSGRCLLSAFLSQRDANRGECAHPCRWKYYLTEELRPQDIMKIYEDKRGSYIFNSKDLCMIEHIPEMINAKINSLKIEGRMKGIHYLATVVNTYKSALNAYYNNPSNYKAQDWQKKELDSINARGYCTGFYFGYPQQNYFKTTFKDNKIFAGKVIKQSEKNNITELYLTKIEARNKIEKGNKIEILKKLSPPAQDTIEAVYDEDMMETPCAQPNQIAFILTKTEAFENDLIRKYK
ncbi:MAG: U32 family peptidase [Deltaproteobacteria bacterium]|nr:U32 family peptidase [Deltaproteobacteria bacterium]